MAKQKPIIAWDNLLERGTVVASSEATGYEAANAYDGLSHDAWKASAAGTSTLTVYCASAQSVDCWGFYGSDLHAQAGTCKLQYSDDGSAWVDIGSVITPTHAGAYLQTFTAASHPFWRLSVTSAGSASYFKHVFIGAKMQLQRGVRSGVYVPQLARSPEVMGNLSEGGAFLGRSVSRQRARLTLSIANMTEAWVRTYWEPFQDYAQKRPFLFAWDIGEHDTEIAFCQVRDPITTAYNDSLYMDSSFSMEALLNPPMEQTDLTLAAEPAAPGSLAAVIGDAWGEIDLSWDAVTPSAGLTYKAYQSATSGGARTLIQSGLTLPAHTVGGLSVFTDYFFAVTALDVLASEGNESNEEAVTIGVGWTPRTALPGAWQSVCWSPDLSLFVAVGIDIGSNQVMTSPDGVTWTARAAAEANTWQSVCWSPDLSLFVAVASTGTNRVMTSPDGTTWTARAASEANSWYSVCWSPSLSLFVAVAIDGTNQVMTSPDGVTWTARSAASSAEWYSVCWSPDEAVFVAVGGGSVMTSTDGASWSLQAAAESNQWYSVCWSPDLSLFAAVSGGGTNRVMTSPDGVTWTARAAAEANSWVSICWSPEFGCFVAVSDSGTNRSMYSEDGIAWESITTSEANGWTSVCWGPSLYRFAAVSDGDEENPVATGGQALV